MNKIFLFTAIGFAIIVSLTALIFLFQEGSNLGEDDLRLFRGIPTAEIPQDCRGFRDDVCGLFDCMVDSCWCDETTANPILWQWNNIVRNEEEAMAAVWEYVQSSGLEYSEVRKAVNLGDDAHRVFFNVFVYNAWGDEKVFTVAADGTIIKTVCGV